MPAKQASLTKRFKSGYELEEHYQKDTQEHLAASDVACYLDFRRNLPPKLEAEAVLANVFRQSLRELIIPRVPMCWMQVGAGWRRSRPQ